ncbi:MAG: hypothetical protein AVDCRST_MAG73-2039, partial [uncultured Thermomicrobiales bacterium]
WKPMATIDRALAGRAFADLLAEKNRATRRCSAWSPSSIVPYAPRLSI